MVTMQQNRIQPSVSTNTKRAAGAALLFVAAVGMIAHDNQNVGGGNALPRRLEAEGGEAATTAGARWAQNHPAARDDCPLSDLDLLLPMHHKDMPLASTLFNSLERAMPCFHELIVIVPPESEYSLTGGIPDYAKVYVVPDPLPSQHGYLSQQVVKLYADTFTTAPRVLILESDLIMKEWHDECFFSVDENGQTNGKVRAYCIGEENNVNDIWFRGTTHAIGGDMVDMDCCVNSPFAFPREVFPAFRQHVAQVHNKPFNEFMEDYYEGHSKGWVPESKLFSEFNILSHFMIRHRPDLVELVTPQTGGNSVKFDQRRKCSEHFIPTRNYDLPNPKLTAEYFDTYYHMLDQHARNKDDGRIRLEIDLTARPQEAQQDQPTEQADEGAPPQEQEAIPGSPTAGNRGRPPSRALEQAEAHQGEAEVEGEEANEQPSSGSERLRRA